MGLDIVAYEFATPTEHLFSLGPHGIPEAWCEEDHVLAFVYEGFEQSLDGLEAGRCYTVGGRYECFRAGSYGGYSAWRADLAAQALSVDIQALWADPDRYRDEPFYELLNFADNEGTIGPIAAARLAADFDAFDDSYKGDEYDRSKYDAWRSAFHLAADTGLVKFT